jgi:hypothetical protein
MTLEALSRDAAPSRFIAQGCIALTLAVVALLLLFLRGESGLMGEDGPIEISSALLYLAAAVTLLLSLPAPWVGRMWQVPMAFLLATARELDFDKAFLAEGILQLRLYTGAAPLSHKLIGGAVLLLIFWTGTRLLRRGVPPLLHDLRAGASWPVLTLAGLAAILGAKLGLDGLGRKLAGFGVELSGDMVTTAPQMEEWIELIGGVLLILAVLAWVRARAGSGD